MTNLKKLVLELESNIPLYITTSSISSGSVGWHIEHALKVIIAVLTNLQKSDPKAYQYKFNKLRSLIFFTNTIPRGKAKAPKQVLAEESFDKKENFERINQVRDLLEAIKLIGNKHYFDHHVFGMLNKKKTLKFLKIHTNHHLKIIRDIKKS